MKLNQTETDYSNVLESQLTYWKQQLSGTLPTLPLPTDYPRAVGQNDQDAHHSLVLSSRLTEALKALSQQQDVTLFMTLLAAFKMMLYRQTGIDDIIVGTPIALRNRVETEEGIDLFFNKLVLRTDLSGNPSFRELLQRIRKVTLDAYAHQEVPFEKVLEELQSERSQHPKFDVLFNFINTSATDLEVTEFSLNTFEKSSESQFLMMLNVEEQDGVLNLQLAYQAALFSKPRILVFLSQYQYLLEQIVVAIDTPISDYSLVTPDSQLLLPNPSMVLSQPTYETVTSLILSWAERNPALPAVSQDHDTWNYRELTNCAQAIAQVLLSQGIKSGEVVAVCGSRRFGLITSMIGAWLSGGVLLTLDENLPSQRQQLMLKEAQAKYLLHLGEKPHEEYEIGEFITYLRIDPDTGYPVDSVPGTRPLPKISSEEAAYIFFTSGTTGIPKGVLGWHNGLSHFLNWQRQTFEVGPSYRCAQLTGLSFDVVLRDIFLALTSGATLCLPDTGVDLSPEHILPWLEREQISVIHTVPSLAQSWLSNVPAGVTLSALRKIFIAGEPLKDKLVRQWRDTFPEAGEIINLYGATETTLTKCYYRVPAEILPGVQPVGSPLPNCQALVLAKNQQLCGIGEPGEIVLRTPFRSLGYINASDKDQQRFVKNPFSTAEDDLLYYTGDRGRYRPDGSLEILGRLDNQVKIRGIRIELEEIEVTLSQHEAVQEAVVVLYDKENNPRLVAYVTLTMSLDEVASVLRTWLKTRLPEYMLPASFTVLDKMPLTPNGKIDRKALPAPDLSIQAEQQTPRTETEQLLCNLWSQVLGIEVTSVLSHFFAAGGHSLSATQLASRIRANFGVEMPLRLIFEQPILIDQAKWLENEQRGSELPSISPLTEGEPLVLSFAQQRLWFLAQLEGQSATYNMPAAWHLSGKFDETALQRALITLIQRHDSLRLCFPEVDGNATVQLNDVYNPLSVTDISELSSSVQQYQVTEWVANHAQTPFDLTTGPLLRLHLLKLSEQEQVLLFNIHHIVSDGWSMDVLIQELSLFYNAYAQNQVPYTSKLPIQYTDYAAWQRNWLQGAVLELQLSFWIDKLTGAPELLELPTDYPRPAMIRYQGKCLQSTLEPELTRKIKQFSQQHDATVFMTLLAAFNVLLSRYSGQTDLVVGSPIAHRTHQQIEDLIGFFVNNAVLRTQIQGTQTFSQLLQQVRQTALEAYSHQDIPFEYLVEQLNPSRSLSYSPLFQVMFALQNAPNRTLEFSDLKISVLESEHQTAKFDLFVNVTEHSDVFVCDWEYNTDLFRPDTITRMAEHFHILLDGIIKNPEQPLFQYPLLTNTEQQQLLAWNQTQTDYPKNQTLVDLFQAQVEKTPDNIAVVYENQQLSYRELNQKANQLAHYLRHLKTDTDNCLLITDNCLVGICVERSVEMVIGLLGILKAGGAYVPLDPDYPQERLQFMLEDSAAPILLSQSHLLSVLPISMAKVICLDSEWELIATYSAENPTRQSEAENLAYVIYTSGSTGVPKGVMIEHDALINFLSYMQQRVALTSTDKLLAITTLSFDIAALELYLPLITGSQSIIINRETASNGEALLQKLTEYQITIMQATPATWKLLLQSGWHQLTPLTILCGGEALPTQLGQTLLENSQQLWNVYGPTETTIWSSIHDVTQYPEKPELIGRPIANTQIYILDANHNPTPLGIPGELCIGGVGLARGYLKRPKLTAEKFIEIDVFGKRQRLYKTGDLARLLPNGNFEYLGRLDHQVKLRGFRIELSEIEVSLSQHEAVKEAVVVIYNQEDNPRLVAYVTLAMPIDDVTSVLRIWLKARLPEYMVPASVTVLDFVPLTPNGKIDRKALPAPDWTIQAESQIPQTETELLLCNLWSQVLGIEVTSSLSHFFEAGGHSLLATQLVSRIRESFGVEMPLRVIFDHAIVQEQAKWLDNEQRGSELPPIIPRAEGEPLVLSFAQQRLWFLVQLQGKSTIYNMPTALHLTGQLNETALQRALIALIQRHESLRLFFPIKDGKVTVEQGEVYNPLSMTDLSELSETSRQQQITEWIANHAQTSFDFSTGPLFSLHLLKLGQQEQILLFNMHHIISDDWSMGILIRDLSQLYNAYAQNQVPHLSKLPIQYTDYAVWQRNWLQGAALEQQLAYWTDKLSGAPELLELPTDYPRPAIMRYQGKNLPNTLDIDLTQEIKQFSQQQGVTVFMTLLTAFKVLLSCYTGQTDIVVGSPIANRTHHQTENLIGFFANILVLRTQIESTQTFAELLFEVKQTALEAYSHQDISFGYLVEQLNPIRSLSHSPLFQVTFVLQNAPQETLELSGLKVSVLESKQMKAKYDLILTIREQNKIFSLDWQYNTDLFHTDTITRLAEHFQVLLEGIINNPEQSLSQLPLLTKAEQQQLLAFASTSSATRSATDYSFGNTIVDLFQAQVEKTPDNLAVVFEEQALSYRELNQKANQLAHYLLNLKTDTSNSSLITDNCLVGICVERSVEMVIGLLGILKAGGAYVPLDPDYPKERLQFMLEDSAVAVLLSQSHLLEQLPASTAFVICLDSEWEQIAIGSEEDRVRLCSPENLAYVIYTSGSTGKPKGVPISHQNVLPLLNWSREYFKFDEQTMVLQNLNYSFDFGAFELFTTLLFGGILHIRDKETQWDASSFVDYVNEHGINTIHTTPSFFRHMTSSGKKIESLKILHLGGETLTWDMVKSLFTIVNDKCLVYNGYGPTEATINCAIFAIGNQEVWKKMSRKNIPIGKPSANNRLYILDKNAQPVTIGVSGELHVGGVALTCGYLNRFELTAEKFIEIEVFGKPQRLYKTGDLARWLPDGNLEYLGRIDHQVKLRGFRIELGEIESVLNQHQAVKEAVVVLHNIEPNSCLVAYITLAKSLDDVASVLRVWLRTSLPEYMLPTSVTVLDKLPLTPNGKIDRQALSELSVNLELSEGEFVTPRTQEEKWLAGIWTDVLGMEKVGIHNNFFDLGGHSLLLTRVQAKLLALFDRQIPMVELFEYPTIHTLAQHLTKQTQPTIQNRADKRRTRQTSTSDIAIIGLSARFPGAATIDEFWHNLREGVESISFFSDEELIAAGIESATFKQPNYVKAKAVLANIELFDADFFDFNPREAELTDPQHRIFLECAWESLENAGYALHNENNVIGVYAGVGMNAYLLNNLYPKRDTLASNYSLMIGNDKDFLPTRVSYKLNLRGPSINVQTACSTSLVAVHLACQSLLNGECDMALAGGVSITLLQKAGYWYREGMINSPDGHCRAFDAKAKGTVDGNGVGIVVLKRLEQAIADGDHIHAVIKGSALNNDGFLKVGYTAPSVEGQAAVISEAQAIADIEAETISYIEAHGTGTELGDPIEIAALTKAFRATTEKNGFCAIGSLKTNIGHTDAAAGIAGLIKTVLALKHRLLPPSLHFEQPNPQIDFANSPFYVNSTLSEWHRNGTPRRAGVSSFGIGGTNAHVILEEAPDIEPSEPSRPWQLLVLSAKTPSALETTTANLANYLAQHPDINLADVAYTLHCGRQSFKYRQMLVCQNTQEATMALRFLDPEQVFTAFQSLENRPVVFMFSGQGAQYVNMGYELYQTEPLFREEVDKCSEYLKPHLGLDLREVLYPSEENITEATQQLKQTAITQTALFVIEYALAKLWMSWGVYLEAMIGHSIGEYVAACLAKVFSLEEALSLVAARGQLMQSLPFGAMLAVLLPESELQPLLRDGLSVAAINHPRRCVVSGTTDAVEVLQNKLTQQGVECRRLHTSHAFHSEMMNPILTAFTERVKQVKLNPPQIPYLSNVTGTWMTAAEATNPNYWATHLRQTVRFSSGLRQILEDSTRILLEVGPGRTLTTLAKQHPDKVAEHRVLSSLRHPDDNQSDVAFLLNTLGQLWLVGGSVDWSGFYANERRQRLPLPTYPFERQRYWIEPSSHHQSTQAESLPIAPKPIEPTVLHARSDLLKTYVAPCNQLEQTIADIWSQYLGIKQISTHDNYFELGGDSLLAVQVIAKLRDTLQVELVLHHIIEAPTVHRLASLIEKRRIFSQEKNAILVEIQSGDDSNPPLFCLHPAGGGVFSYLNLAPYLPEQAIYGIQTPSLVGEKEPPSLMDKATHYIEVIKKIQPKGPYLLAGMSYGGNMAVEMAIQLQQQRDEVALVALFDSYPSLSYENQSEDNWDFLTVFLATSELMLGCPLRDILNEELKQRSEDEQWQYILEHVAEFLPEEVIPDEIPKFFNIWKTHHVELHQHVSQIYPGCITLFKASEGLPDALGMEIDDALVLEGWRKFSSKPIEYIRVPGNHFNMLDEPHVQILAGILRLVIKKVL